MEEDSLKEIETYSKGRKIKIFLHFSFYFMLFIPAIISFRMSMDIMNTAAILIFLPPLLYLIIYEVEIQKKINISRLGFYSFTLISAAFSLFILLLVSDAGSAGLAGIFLFLFFITLVSLPAIMALVFYEIKHHIKKEESYKNIIIIASCIFLAALITSIRYILPSFGTPYFFMSSYFSIRLILLFFSGLIIILSLKKVSFVRFLLLLLFIFLAIIEIGGFGFLLTDHSRGDFNKDMINERITKTNNIIKR